MNIHAPEIDRQPNDDQAAEALATLQRWAAAASEAEIAALDPKIAQLLPGAEATGRALSRTYPDDFSVDDAYRATLPDLQNGPSSLIRGEKALIQHVGISNFRLPIRYHTREGAELTLETSVTGSVSLEAEKKGINMSRIMRTFYARSE